MFAQMTKKIALILILAFSVIYSQNTNSFNPDTVRTGKFDTGKMWTFDNPPTEYLEVTYGFDASEEWLEKARLAALRIPGCSASFVSGNGLLLTNHHCSEGHARRIQAKGEDIAKTGFYAASLDQERKVPRMFADQLVLIQDVTSEVNAGLGENIKGRQDSLQNRIENLQKKYSGETGLRCTIYAQYSGARYALYGYKRYTDIRLVFIPEAEMGYFGGDFDNFTYPRYSLDFTLFRVYDENGEPLKTDHYYKWSPTGPAEDEVIFTVGNPGRTNRLFTVAMLEYLRDYSYRNRTYLMQQYTYKLQELKTVYPDRADEFEDIITGIGNGRKVTEYVYSALQDEYLMARKAAFEKTLREKVKSDETKYGKYSSIWENVSNLRAELREIAPVLETHGLSGNLTARSVDAAKKFYTYILSGDKNKVAEKTELDSLTKDLFRNYDQVLDREKLKIFIDICYLNLPENDALLKDFLKGKRGYEAADFILSGKMSGDDKLAVFTGMTFEQILLSDDPLIGLVKATKEKFEQAKKTEEEIFDSENDILNELGNLIYALYGDQVPPDANFSLRLSDGVLRGFDYNGTISPVKTTFYGMYDRYYSNNKQYPWGLPERWANPPAEFKLSSSYNFVSTNDIVGGNSGSPVINQNLELVGVAFDGNVKSIAGNFIYMPHENRCVSVSSEGMLNALKYIYKADRIAGELETGSLK
ncbi:MAG: S46 family peptidase [Ignavibacteriales bacterium]|nr:S46 family peptidase [Ignavibacteriales bacterium]MCF8315050.1 S46 family peptidase [Ignavibacteriales bacterium]MCF8435954.1 S46 family peptidase [Ignavibacteriales bacterium]